MSNEIRKQKGLFIQKTSSGLTLVSFNKSQGYVQDLSGDQGPSPGAFDVPAVGVAVDLSGLDSPYGESWWENQHPTVIYEVGIRDVSSGLFYPLVEVLPGKAESFRLTRNLLKEYTAPGTGTGSQTNQLFVRPQGGSAGRAAAYIFEA